jgi:hypothetical protein
MMAELKVRKRDAPIVMYGTQLDNIVRNGRRLNAIDDDPILGDHLIFSLRIGGRDQGDQVHYL